MWVSVFAALEWPRHNARVAAEQLIALEAAVGEIGGLYTAARNFAALHERAEHELLPQVVALGSRLRSLVRRAQLTDAEIDAAAITIMAVGSEWREALVRVHASELYQQTLAAFAADRQDELAQLIPQVFAGVTLRRPPPSLCLSFSPSAGRRRPGTSPFLSASACADKLTHLLDDGIAPDTTGAEWWERELPMIECADSPGGLDTPIWIRIAAAEVRVAVFAVETDLGCGVFTPRLRAPMSIGIAADATDEWWQAYEDSYHSFRGELLRELTGRGIRVDG